MDKKDKQQQELEKKIKKGLIAGLTSASVLVGSTFDSPQDIINNPTNHTKPVVEQYYDQDDQKQESNSKHDELKEKLKKLIYKIPINIRVYICIPLWFLGTAILTLLDVLLKVVIVPLAHVIINFALHVLLLVAAVGICVKLLFPDLPWSKIFNKRTILLILLGSLILSVCDIIMPIFWDKYLFYRNVSKLAIGIIFLLIILRPFIKKKLENLYTYQIIYGDETLELEA